MPELPEVETVRRTLLTQIIGKKITNLAVYYDKIIENVDPLTFQKSLIGETFQDIDRYGKYLIFILDHYSIISHLRMEGKFFLKNPDDERSKHEHIIFTLDEKISFRYHDTRKFGKMILLKTTKKQDILQYPTLNKLGKEANDQSFTKEELYNIFHQKKVPLKVALLDQEIICGLGNIYADEVCFMSGLNPHMLTNHLTLDDANNILLSARLVLKKAIEKGGTTIRSYTSSLGVTGLFQLELLVHTKENEPCPKCHTLIRKEFVGGRGTYYCPKCQRKHFPKVIGITGAIASGKTTVTNYLEEKNYQVVDADTIVKDLKKPSKAIYQALVKAYGTSILTTDGLIDDKLLAQMVFNDEKSRLKINQIIHPLVYEECEKQILNTTNHIIFLSIPLLFEAHFEDLCDQIICVNIDEQTQLTRLMNRNHLSIEEANKRINSQMPLEEKCQKATFIIDNSREICYTIEQIEKILQMVGD